MNIWKFHNCDIWWNINRDSELLAALQLVISLSWLAKISTWKDTKKKAHKISNQEYCAIFFGLSSWHWLNAYSKYKYRIKIMLQWQLGLLKYFYQKRKTHKSLQQLEHLYACFTRALICTFVYQYTDLTRPLLFLHLNVKRK